MNLSLRECLKRRIRDDIIGSEKRDNCLGTVMVLDNRSSEILSSVLKLPELMQKGVTMIENLRKTRKAYPSFRAVYLVEPTKESFNLIQNDFDKKALYGALYVYATRKISDDVFQFLSSLSFVKLALALQEANLDLLPLTPCVFRLGQRSGWELELDGLLSLLSSLREVDRVEVFKPIGEKYRESAQLQRAIGARVKELLPGLKGEGEGYKLKLFLVDRGVDLVTPLMHDFHYEALITDLMQDAGAGEAPRDLNDGDAVFAKYRYQFIKETMTGVSADFELFLKENPAAQMLKNRGRGEEMKLEKMADVVAGLGQYNKLVEDYNYHIEKIQQILAESERAQAKDLADVEILAASAVNAAGEVVDSAKRLEIVRKLLPALSEENALRLAMIAQGCVHKDCAPVRAALGPAGQKLFDAHAALVERYGKYWPEKDKEKHKAISLEAYRREDSSLKRHVVKIEYLLRNFLKGGDRSFFEGVSFGEAQAGGARGNKAANTLFKIKMKNVKSEVKELVVVYFTGGVSYVEIRALKQLERDLDGPGFIVGGNAVFSPRAFIEDYVKSGA